jgi:hypothetical protein
VPQYSVLHVILSVLGVIVVFILLVAVPRRAATSLVVEASSDEEPTWRLVGSGSWWGPWYWPLRTSWPLVRLEIFSWGVRVGPNMSWMAWAVPTTEMTWPEMLVARRTRAGVRFRPRSNPRRSVRFWPVSDERLMLVLRTKAWRSSRGKQCEVRAPVTLNT